MNQIFLSLQQRKQHFVENQSNTTIELQGSQIDNHLLYIRNCHHCPINVTCQKIEKILVEKCDNIQLTLNVERGIRTSMLELFHSHDTKITIPTQSNTNLQLVTIDSCKTLQLLINDRSLLQNLSIVHSNSSDLNVNHVDLHTMLSSASLSENKEEDEEENLKELIMRNEPVKASSQVIGTKQYKSYWRRRVDGNNVEKTGENDNCESSENEEMMELVTELVLREGAHGYMTTKSEVEKRFQAHINQ